MKREIRFTPGEQSQHGLSSHSEQSAGMEFGSVEAMLRHDALHTPVPPSIEHRLRESLGRGPAPARPWWRRLLGL
jgi:hypothetical protein